MRLFGGGAASALQQRPGQIDQAMGEGATAQMPEGPVGINDAELARMTQMNPVGGQGIAGPVTRKWLAERMLEAKLARGAGSITPAELNMRGVPFNAEDPMEVRDSGMGFDRNMGQVPVFRQ